MAKVGHLDIIGGISGDMFLGALLDAGVDSEQLQAEIRKVVPQGWAVFPSNGMRGSMTGIQATVMVEEDTKWTWERFREAVNGSKLEQADQDKVLAVLDILETAERDAHGDEDTHLHELGSTDTIVDIVGAVVGLRLFGVTQLTCSALPASAGTASSSHGETASFAPATMAIIERHRLRVRSGHGMAAPVGEAVTPTGAALVAGLSTPDTTLEYAILKSGTGLGTRDVSSPPNVLQFWLGESAEESAPVVTVSPLASMPPELVELAQGIAQFEIQSDLWIVETNIDDSTGEAIGHTLDVLRAEIRVLDAWTQPISMKKNRPGILLSALVNREKLQRCVLCMIFETSTFGIRVRPVERLVLERDTVLVELNNGLNVKAHRKFVGDNLAGVYPEYDDCVRAALELGVPFAAVYREIVKQEWLDRRIAEFDEGDEESEGD